MLSDVLVAGGNSQVARMAAGLQLKNHLTSKDQTLKQSYQQRWLSLPEDIRLYIKKNVGILLFAAPATPISSLFIDCAFLKILPVSSLPLSK